MSAPTFRAACPARVGRFFLAGAAALWLTGVALALSAGTALAAPIRTVAPGTGIFLGNVIVPRLAVIDNHGTASATDTVRASIAGFYSPRSDILLGFALPYFENRSSASSPSRSDGVGDLSLIAHWRFWNSVARGYRDSAALRMTLATPTASHDVSLTDTLDPSLLLAFGRDHRHYSVHGNLGYDWHGSDSGTQSGDVIRADFAVAKRLLTAVTRPLGYEFNVQLELIYRSVARSRVGGVTVAGSGGDFLFVAPGLQMILGERGLVEISWRTPIDESANGPGPGLEDDLLIGMRWAL